MRLSFAAACLVVSACSNAPADLSSDTRLGGSKQGRIAETHGEQATLTIASLEPFAGEPFTNDVVRMIGLPPGLTPDANGCFCFAEDDRRFPYVHTYFHATRALRAWNDRLRELHLPPVADVAIGIEAAPADTPSRGGTTEEGRASDGRRRSKVVFSIGRPIVDPMLIVHELAHVVDIWIRDPQLSPPPASAIPLESRELAANLLAVPQVGQTKYLEFTLLDAALAFVKPGRYPESVVSERQVLEGWLAAPRFTAAYPTWTATLRTELMEYEGRTNPDAYGNNFLVLAPVIELMNTCSKAAVTRMVLSSLSKLHVVSKMGDLTLLLAERAPVDCPAQADAFERELRERGVLPPIP
jgi:hypothetical protein